jgi:hypothetical protein
MTGMLYTQDDVYKFPIEIKIDHQARIKLLNSSAHEYQLKQ